MHIGSTEIQDSFAEAFDMQATRIIVTAADDFWLQAAVSEFSGYAASVIACDAEVGVERSLSPEESPDGRPGAAILLFGKSQADLGNALTNRAGQCLMTCPTTAVFDGLPGADNRVPLGKHLRFFGDGYQKSKRVGSDRYWRIPVMDGEFVVADRVGIQSGVAGGNLILQGRQLEETLTAAREAAEAVARTAEVMSPFPGGVVRSGSKVGSRYRGMVASTADAYCPTLRGRVPSRLLEQAHCAYEIVIDGLSAAAVEAAMVAAARAACRHPLVALDAGNYGGKLGRHQFRLRDLLHPFASDS